MKEANIYIHLASEPYDNKHFIKTSATTILYALNTLKYDAFKLYFHLLHLQANTFNGEISTKYSLVGPRTVRSDVVDNFDQSIQELLDAHYLIPGENNCFDFYESPYHQPDSPLYRGE